ncbi:hypothetical protein HanXRQr2_Chr02g0055321 [Helianthus annuus]|uniref:Uncharacterized protein n=1 Tax=Helianthus annuus TaxID=4232 RepID=A0A9K3JND6_HELAN|nr:hypothetical protein HanXRQr2_Chr02g0055321 [Helianthus annuus]
MESSSFSFFFPCILIITLLIFSHTMFSSVKPVVVIHLSEDLYTRSRMPLFRLLCPRFRYPLYTLSVTLRLIAGPITFLGRLLVLIIFLMAVILILIDPLDGFLMAEFLWIFLMRCLMKCLNIGLILLNRLCFGTASRTSVCPKLPRSSGSVQDMMRGLNYASAGAGIIFSSGSELHISFGQQIQQVMDTFQQFILTMGE